jgi:activating signal cointegrator 1
MMRFSVASWYLHRDDPDWWIAHNGYTTMCSPPAWAREADRNLWLFAPPKEIVFGDVTEEEYKDVYRKVMRSRHQALLGWIAHHDGEHVILLCACPDGQFCHRHLIAKLLTWLGCEEVPLPAEEALSGTMKALSIINPWAVLIGHGKQFETRSWSTSYRGPIAIHASKGWKRDDQRICLCQPFKTDLVAAGFHTIGDILATCGCVIATAQLTDCIAMDEEFIFGLDDRELEYGLFRVGRYAWRIDDVQTITPVPARGQQGLWNWTMPVGVDRVQQTEVIA